MTKKLTVKSALKYITGGELSEREKRFVKELELRGAITKAINGGLDFRSLSRALRDSIEDDLFLTALIDNLKEYGRK